MAAGKLSGDQRVLCRQLRKTAEIPVGRPQGLDSMMQNERRDPGVMDLRAFYAALLDEELEPIPIAGRFCQ